MARKLFLGSLLVCLICIALVQIDDATIFGIRGEPDTILYYGGLGLLAGLTGMLAAVSGIYWALSRWKGMSPRSRVALRTAVLIILVAVLISLAVRFAPDLAGS